MGIAEIITMITGAIGGILKVVKISREALAKGLEEMASEVRAGALLPDSLFEQVHADSDRLNDIRNSLPDD